MGVLVLYFVFYLKFWKDTSYIASLSFGSNLIFALKFLYLLSLLLPPSTASFKKIFFVILYNEIYLIFSGSLAIDMPKLLVVGRISKVTSH